MPFNPKSLVQANARAGNNGVVFTALYQDVNRQARAFTHVGGQVFSFATATPSGWIADGKRLTLAGTLPPVLTSAATWYLEPEGSVPGQTFKLKDAAGVYASPANGTVSGATAYDLDISEVDTIESLVSYEASWVSNRPYESFNTGTFNTALAQAEQVTNSMAIQNTTSGLVEMTHALVMIGGSSSPGSTYCDYYGLKQLYQSITAGNEVSLKIKQIAKNS